MGKIISIVIYTIIALTVTFGLDWIMEHVHRKARIWLLPLLVVGATSWVLVQRGDISVGNIVASISGAFLTVLHSFGSFLNSDAYDTKSILGLAGTVGIGIIWLLLNKRR